MLALWKSHSQAGIGLQRPIPCDRNRLSSVCLQRPSPPRVAVGLVVRPRARQAVVVALEWKGAVLLQLGAALQGCRRAPACGHGDAVTHTHHPGAGKPSTHEARDGSIRRYQTAFWPESDHACAPTADTTRVQTKQPLHLSCGRAPLPISEARGQAPGSCSQSARACNCASVGYLPRQSWTNRGQGRGHVSFI